MTPIDFPQSNRNLLKPKSMTDEECKPLRVHDTGQELISCWKLSWRERLQLLFSGKVWLWIIGRGHPPVLLTAEPPFSFKVRP